MFPLKRRDDVQWCLNQQAIVCKQKKLHSFNIFKYKRNTVLMVIIGGEWFASDTSLSLMVET